MTDDFTPLTTCDHWLGDDPALEVRNSIAAVLAIEPGGRPREDARERFDAVIGAHLQFERDRQCGPCDNDLRRRLRNPPAAGEEVRLTDQTNPVQLRRWNLFAQDPLDRTYFEINAELAWASDKLKARIYELDAPSESSS